MRTIPYLVVLALVLPAAACRVGPDRDLVATGGPSVLGPVPGDRGDVPRALLVGLEAAQGALLVGEWDGDTYGASFLIVESLEGNVTAIDHRDGTFTLRAFVEPEGDRTTQQVLLDAWANRLRQLNGVEWAPR